MSPVPSPHPKLTVSLRIGIIVAYGPNQSTVTEAKVYSFLLGRQLSTISNSLAEVIEQSQSEIKPREVILSMTPGLLFFITIVYIFSPQLNSLCTCKFTFYFEH